MALMCYRILKLPEELIGTSLDSIVRKPAFSSVDEKCHWAAEIAESQGDFPKALTYYHLYAERIMFDTYGDFTKIINRFHALEMICAAQEGNMKKVIFHAQQRMKVRPYDNLLLPETLKILREKGDTKTIQALDATIKTFWQNKLIELPNYEPYTQALKDWQEIVK